VEQGFRRAQVDELQPSYRSTLRHERDAVRVTERRTGEHDVFARVQGVRQFDSKSLKPRRSIFVGERNTRVHASDVLGRVEIVGLHEAPADCRAEGSSNRRLASAGNAHDDNGAAR
jgi:hypothetical protein